MTSPFDSKNHIATALDRLALRLLLFMLCVFYFFYLWHSGVSSLIAGSALFLLVLLFILLLERRTLTTRDHALRVRIGGAIALEELLVLPSEQAAQSICTMLCESLGAKPLGSAKLLLETGKHPGELKDMVCSPAGTTIEAVKVLEEMGFRAPVIDAVDACIVKSRKM